MSMIWDNCVIFRHNCALFELIFFRHMNDITDKLIEFGLSKKAATAFLAILRLQEASAHQIASEAELERTTIYKILDELSKKELVEKNIKGKRILFSSRPPAYLNLLLEKQEGILKDILPALIAMQGKRTTKPQVKFYESVESIKQCLMNTLDCQEKVRRDFASVESIVDFLGQRFINHQIEERVRRKIAVRSLRCTSSNDIEKKDWYLRKENKEILREVRYLDQKWSFEPVIFIHDNTMTIISSKKESYALVIESKELSRALKILFDIAWRTVK